MGTPKKTSRKNVSIKRPSIPNEAMTETASVANPSTPTTPIAPIPSATGGINMASTFVETDPFRKSVIDAGYAIQEENEYGVVVRMEKGKPTFIPRTQKGFDPSERTVRCTVVVPEHIDIAMKVHTAKNRMSASQYIIQLIVADLRKNGDL